MRTRAFILAPLLAGCAMVIASLTSPLAPAFPHPLPAREGDPPSAAPGSAPVTLEGIEGPNGLLLLRPGRRESLTCRLRGGAAGPAPRDAAYSYALTDRDGRERARGSGVVTLAAGATASLSLDVDTTGLRYGIYYLRLRVEAKEGVGSGAPPQLLLDSESYVGVASPTKLRKAKDGEFLYGLDVQLGDPAPDSPVFRWMGEMGVDIVRGGLGWTADPAHASRRMPLYDAYGLRVMMMVDPPKERDAARRREVLSRRCRDIEEVARRFPRLRYWEMGNEPDLPGFYPGPIEDYAADYAEMYQAVKRGNPRTVVMNGGLCFAGDEAKRRARRFAEVVDPGVIDAWAYHGHGRGAEAERSALEMMRRTAREFGKGDRPYAQTESGVAARTRAQEEMQARTAVQKLVYAQSERLPLFMWFRLLMFEEDYGGLADRSGRQPRPVVLSYRATVEALRGHSFRRSIETGKPDVSAHLFAAGAAAGASEAARACVLWADRPVVRTVTLALASRPGGAKNLRLLDKYGNSVPVAALPGGGVQVTVTEDPVFLKWDTSEPGFAVRTPEPVLGTAPVAQLVFGIDNAVAVTVRNPLGRGRRFEGVLEARAAGGGGDAAAVAITPAARRVSLAPGATGRMTFMLRPDPAGGGVRWPRQWAVFPNVDPARADAAALDSVPETLPGEGGGPPVPARRVTPREHAIDFERAGGRRRERSAALAVAEVFSDADRTVTVGASADWWMAWHVNGEKAYDTLKGGNGAGYAITDHAFPVRLKKGRNLVAVTVLSGSQGWKLLAGSPEALRRAQAPPGEAPQVVLTLREAPGGAGGPAGRVLAREAVEVQHAAPVGSPPAGLSWTSGLALWEQEEPDAVLGATGLINFWEKEPDASRWWKGEADLSAAAWLRADQGRLYLVVKVLDDVHAPSADPAALWQRDSLQVGVARPGGAGYDEYAVALTAAGGAAVYKHARAVGAAVGVLSVAGGEMDARAERDDAAGVTVYRLRLDRGALRTAGGDGLLINLAVNDSDGGGIRKQSLQWRPGMVEAKDTSLWYRAVVNDGAAK